MARIYKLSRTGLRFLYKIRHHRGHGIHSPFVYNLIRKVIEEKNPYYAYNDVKEYLDTNGIPFRTNKYNKLSFRLVNYFGAKHIMEIGSGEGINTLYLTAPAKDIKCICVEASTEKYTIAAKTYENWGREITLLNKKELPSLNKKQDCIFIDLNNYRSLNEDIATYLSSNIHENTFIVVKGIRTNKRCRALWNIIANMEERTVLLDLFNIGVVFFNKKLYRWSYPISF